MTPVDSMLDADRSTSDEVDLVVAGRGSSDASVAGYEVDFHAPPGGEYVVLRSLLTVWETATAGDTRIRYSSSTASQRPVPVRPRDPRFVIVRSTVSVRGAPWRSVDKRLSFTPRPVGSLRQRLITIWGRFVSASDTNLPQKGE